MWFKLRSVLFALCAVVACESMTASEAWTCGVMLTLVPSTFGSMSSPSGSGSGTGTGASEQEALQEALATACAQLSLDGSTLAQCQAGQDFNVEGGGQGNIRLLSAVERSVQCQGSS
ncbi:MAG: hypothetical protein OXI46_07270 [Gemmatimonadota bacterium]|nr:hypothetical protein [Gemmatimonadota bacterium]